MLTGWPPLNLVTILIFLSAENVIANINIWADSLHESSGKLSQLSDKTRVDAFWLLELEIWAENWTVSGLQDRFRLLLLLPFGLENGTFKSWTLHESSGKLSQLSKKIRIGTFGLLELKIWAEHWTMSRLQDKFWLLRCC